MDLSKRLLLLIKLLNVLTVVSTDTFSVKIITEQHVNVVDSRFLSFTIDPKYLFSSSEKYNSKECICMASSLTPAYIRIAGPSTAHMTFKNTTIAITDDDEEARSADGELAVGYRQWRKFAQWAKSTGFDLVFALNNEERMTSGMWDPNTALNILTVAEKAKIGDIFWQLGYECTNQSIEEYLNDLETLRVITETFPPGRSGDWKVVGGDVTNCLHADSKSDFKDYVMLSTDMMDAVMLNGNSSSQELERMSEVDRLKLLKLLSHSTTPLWLTETTQKRYNELHRAADWLSSLGYSARNGFSVHYRELIEDEMYEPSLSFYMALLFKNLVGERVLSLDMIPDEGILFAHCTSLRHKAVPGAVTLYGANMDDEPARYSLKLSKREEGGDIMQFILGYDHSGNIVVNGRAMFYDGDIKPVVKHVRPYKTLLIKLPPKSFGFWVLANTNVEACQDIEEEKDKTLSVEAVPVSDEDQGIKVKRSINVDPDFKGNIDLGIKFFDNNEKLSLSNLALNDRVINLNNDLVKLRKKVKNNQIETRTKRQIDDDHQDGKRRRILRKVKSKIDKVSAIESKSKVLFGNLLTRRNITRNRHNRNRKHTRFAKNKVSKRNSKNNKVKSAYKDQEIILTRKENITRKRRSVMNDKHSTEDIEDILIDNDIDVGNQDNAKLWKILRKIHKQLQDLSTERDEYVDEKISNGDSEHVVDNTNLSDDDATINLSEISNTGFIKSTVHNLITILADLNKNLNKF